MAWCSVLVFCVSCTADEQRPRLTTTHMSITNQPILLQDIIFNFHKAYYVLDEIFIGGQLQETSKRKILQMCAIQDEMMEESSNATDR